ncbi:hypothetical protein JD969_07625 [Planctomycetota bacterium]|nr:hypothetical protein JD969_07625 [Planctomycetota bacterium]
MQRVTIFLICLLCTFISSKLFALDIIEFGAKGDGKTDNTQAFQDAIDACAQAGGGIINIPTGQYLIKSHLTLQHNVTLQGQWVAPPTISRLDSSKTELPYLDQTPLAGTVLLAVENENQPDNQPFITMKTNSTLKGLTIYYPNQGHNNKVVEYPWTIASGAGDNMSIINVLLLNPYKGVDFGSRATGRHYINGLYGAPIFKGLYVDRCLDVGRINNVHFWPFWREAPDTIKNFTRQNGEAFIFGRTDWQYVDNCFAIFYKTGFKFIEGKEKPPYHGGGNVLLNKSGGDMCQYAVLVEQVQGHSGVSFTNSNIFGTVLIKPENHGPVKFTGCSFFGSDSSNEDTPTASIQSAGHGPVMISNSHFIKLSTAHRGKPYIIADSGRISVIGCTFADMNTPDERSPSHIVLKTYVKAARIVANEFFDPMRIQNHAEGATVIESNLSGTQHINMPLKE